MSRAPGASPEGVQGPGRRALTALLTMCALLAVALVPAIAVGRSDHAPSVTPVHVGSVTATTASVWAKVNTRGDAGTYAFAWTPTAGPGARTPEATLPAVNGNQDVVATLVGLTPGTTYSVQVVATNATGTSTGAATEFTTAPAAAPPNANAGGTPGQEDQPGEAGGDSGDDALPNLVDGPAATRADAVVGRRVVVGAREGTVKVKVRGTDGFAVLGAGAAVPVGSVVDATRGTVRLTSAVGGDATQDVLLRGSKFEVRQTRAGRGMTDLVLRGGDFASCARSAVVRSAAHGPSRRAPRRSLWAQDRSGRFRTHGRNSVATVRGTEWTTTDTCRGTTTRVRKGAVLVRDRGRGRGVLVKAGERHLAPARRR